VGRSAGEWFDLGSEGRCRKYELSCPVAPLISKIYVIYFLNSWQGTAHESGNKMDPAEYK
jgi:hypothetical protein